MQRGGWVAQDYQRRKNNPYFLPGTLYQRVLAVIRDYERERSEMVDMLYSIPKKDMAEVSKSNGDCKPTERKAIILSFYKNDIDAVVLALEKLPAEYRQGVFRNIVYRERFSDIAAYRTWIRQKQKFVFEVAKNLNLI